MRGKFTIFIMFLFLISSVHALEYIVQINSPSSISAYEGENSGNIFQGNITNNGQFCDISCTWTTTLNTVSEPGATIKVQNNGVPKPFNFNVWALGSNGLATYTISVNCKRILVGLCLAESPDQRISELHSFSFFHKNDGICTTEREKCANYFDDETNFLKDPSCTCSSTTQCNPSSERGSDSKGCATYCGNKVKESQYETCNNCPGDVGKCDGQSCNSKSECEGNYCVHNKCSHVAYIKGDTYCDSNVGESCLNSPSDCACSSSEKCNSQGKCETYCGNGICESSEQGSCKADCQWCGDGTCDPKKETCKGCPSDCGECEKTEEEEQITQQLNKIKEEAQTSAKKTKDNQVIINIVIGSTLGLIVLLVIGYIIYKKMKENKHHKENKSKHKEIKKCPKCNAKTDGKSKFCSECGHKLK